MRRVGQRQMGEVRRVNFKSDFFSAPCLELEVGGSTLRFVEANPMAAARVRALFAKEPTTIPWLDCMEPADTLVDIGANMGLYSIYAAVVAGCRVFAFEPESLNYAELNKNIHVSGLHDRVSAFCVALSNESKVGYLHLGAFGYAYSHHDFGENTWTKDMVFGEGVTRKDARLRQGCVSSTLDELVSAELLPVPDHIKIDVDGLESRVVAGCARTLADPRVRTCLVEIDFAIDSSTAVIDLMVSQGWKYSMEQLRTNRKRILSEEDVERVRRNHRGGFNYIFFRDEAYRELFAHFLSEYHPPMAE